MIYLLDANVLIDADDGPYPIDRFPVFWNWLAYKVETGQVRVPIEIFEEIRTRRGDPLHDWLHLDPTHPAIISLPDVNPELVRAVTVRGYAPDLTEDEIPNLGRDPFLIAHALADRDGRCVVTNEGSKPGRQRAKRHVPDVCADLGVRCINLFRLVRDLDFSTDWQPVP